MPSDQEMVQAYSKAPGACIWHLHYTIKECNFQGCSLGLKRLGRETVSRRFFERLGLVSTPSLQSLGLISVSRL